MTKVTLVAGALCLVAVALAVAVCHRDQPPETPVAAISPAPPPPREPAAAAAIEVPPASAYQGLLYGRVHTADGTTFEGRLRWGGTQEAFWGDYFNGTKDSNRWAAAVPAERLPKERRTVEVFGIELGYREHPANLERFFMARFGEITRIEAAGSRVQVTLKSGTVFALDRYSASDFDDGVRVWDDRRGMVDLDSLRIRAIELLPTPPLPTVPSRLYGTVHTAHAELTGFLQWNREAGIGSDELVGDSAEGELRLRFDTIRTISRQARTSVLVTLRDGREKALTGVHEGGEGHRGIYVDDPRYGRVLVSWGACQRIDFGDPGAAGNGPAYDDFPPGQPLTGSVTLRDGRRLAGRLVYDLDESETTETLDAPAQGVDYTLPFGRILSIVPPDPTGNGDQGVRVSLRSSGVAEPLTLEARGDVGPGNAGLLVFVEGLEHPEYVPWADVERIDFPSDEDARRTNPPEGR